MLMQTNKVQDTCVCTFVCLQRFLSGENTVADIAANTAGGVLTLTDELPHSLGTWAATAYPILDKERDMCQEPHDSKAHLVCDKRNTECPPVARLAQSIEMMQTHTNMIFYHNTRFIKTDHALFSP